MRGISNDLRENEFKPFLVLVEIHWKSLSCFDDLFVSFFHLINSIYSKLVYSPSLFYQCMHEHLLYKKNKNLQAAKLYDNSNYYHHVFYNDNVAPANAIITFCLQIAVLWLMVMVGYMVVVLQRIYGSAFFIVYIIMYAKTAAKT